MQNALNLVFGRTLSYFIFVCWQALIGYLASRNSVLYPQYLNILPPIFMNANWVSAFMFCFSLQLFFDRNVLKLFIYLWFNILILFLILGIRISERNPLCPFRWRILIKWKSSTFRLWITNSSKTKHHLTILHLKV